MRGNTWLTCHPASMLFRSLVNAPARIQICDKLNSLGTSTLGLHTFMVACAPLYESPCMYDIACCYTPSTAQPQDVTQHDKHETKWWIYSQKIRNHFTLVKVQPNWLDIMVINILTIHASKLSIYQNATFYESISVMGINPIYFVFLERQIIWQDNLMWATCDGSWTGFWNSRHATLFCSILVNWASPKNVFG
jgi:hypothetical protein